MLNPTRRAVTEWLASAHPVPAQARREFDVGIALVPTGVRFDAVRLPAAVVHAAAGSEDPDAVAAFLARALGDGAVIHDAYGVGVWYYALVPPGTHSHWQVPGAECLGPGTWLGVPRPDLTARPGPHWALPPGAVGTVCTVDAVTDLGQDRLGGTPSPPGPVHEHTAPAPRPAPGITP
ncbi:MULTISPECIES: hypothetical protein [unclassified Streptomyces]|uniref:hypothetical protein n=1 Tax=unclassified Streptomyces TaxID=2593676 RepID=UPI0033D7E63A